jgi:putative redox protein
MRVDVNWIDGRQFEAANEEGTKFRMDAKKKSGGSGEHASPTDHLLAAAAACSGMDVVSILQKMRQPIRSLRIEVDGEQEEDYPKYFSSINLRYILEGDNIDRTKVEQAVELSQEKYCSVRASLTDKCKITAEIIINP